MTKIKIVALLSVLILLELAGAMIHKNNINTLESVNITPVMIKEPQEEPVVSEVKEVEQKEFNYYGLTEDELNLVYAVVMQEGGPTYESAEYVMSTIINRVNNPDKWSWAGETIIDQITYPQQYCYSLDDYWKQYLNGNVPDTVKNAVKSVIEFGPVHDYDCFRGYYLEDCEQVADNWYFIG